VGVAMGFWIMCLVFYNCNYSAHYKQLIDADLTGIEMFGPNFFETKNAINMHS
jgi:hypothetical protein